MVDPEGCVACWLGWRCHFNARSELRASIVDAGRLVCSRRVGRAVPVAVAGVVDEIRCAGAVPGWKRTLCAFLVVASVL